MLGLPASAGAPALAETGGRAVAQLLPPCIEISAELAFEEGQVGYSSGLAFSLKISLSKDF